MSAGACCARGGWRTAAECDSSPSSSSDESKLLPSDSISALPRRLLSECLQMRTSPMFKHGNRLLQRELDLLAVSRLVVGF